jgi:hypothetical protein
MDEPSIEGSLFWSLTVDIWDDDDALLTLFFIFVISGLGVETFE